MRQDAPAGANRRQRPLRVTAVLAIAVGIGFVVWLVTRDDSRPATPEASTSATPPPPVAPRARPLLTAVTPQTLAILAADAGQPIYWAGPKRFVKYEVTRTRDRKFYVRYLPRAIPVGSRSGEYLLVGTYPVPDAYRAVQRAGRQPGATTFNVPGGGLAVVNANAPNNIYFAYPNAGYQVEVFDPRAQRARRLVASGAVKPVG